MCGPELLRRALYGARPRGRGGRILHLSLGLLAGPKGLAACRIHAWLWGTPCVCQMERANTMARWRSVLAQTGRIARDNCHLRQFGIGKSASPEPIPLATPTFRRNHCTARPPHPLKRRRSSADRRMHPLPRRIKCRAERMLMLTDRRVARRSMLAADSHDLNI